MFGLPKRIKRYANKFALVDGIPFQLPVSAAHSPVLMAVFPIDADKAKDFLPAGVHPLRLWKSALLIVAVIDYRHTNIGKYVEYSIGIGCTHGDKAAPRLLPALFMNWFNTGQYVLDLPVSSEVSVKGGKGIWGMPKHQANLDFNISADKVSSQYDLDGQLVCYIEIAKPASARIPVNAKASNYCAFRGMLMKSDVFIHAKAGLHLFSKAKARLVIGDHPRLQVLKQLNIGKAIATAFLPAIGGVLDDHIESWFLHSEQLPKLAPEGFESVINLSLSEDWLAPPTAAITADAADKP